MEESPKDARTTIYYKNVMAREMANNTMAKARPPLTPTRTPTPSPAHGQCAPTPDPQPYPYSLSLPLPLPQVLRENAHTMAIAEPEIRVITEKEPKV